MRERIEFTSRSEKRRRRRTREVVARSIELTSSVREEDVDEFECPLSRSWCFLRRLSEQLLARRELTRKLRVVRVEPVPQLDVVNLGMELHTKIPANGERLDGVLRTRPELCRRREHTAIEVELEPGTVNYWRIILRLDVVPTNFGSVRALHGAPKKTTERLGTETNTKNRHLTANRLFQEFQFSTKPGRQRVGVVDRTR